jgi:Zn ribbon nucleic-acid-binding protein
MSNENATPETTTDPAGRAMSDLLACPFCGGKAAHNTMRTSCKDTIRLNGQDEFYGVNCVSCGANNLGILGHATPEKAATHWNHRAG